MEARVNPPYTYTKCKTGVRVVCPHCGSNNEHGVGTGHRECDTRGCPGYTLAPTADDTAWDKLEAWLCQCQKKILEECESGVPVVLPPCPV